MPIPLICPCTAKLRVADHLKGQYIKCPRCGAFHSIGAPNGHAAQNGQEVILPGSSRNADPASADSETVLAQAAFCDAERDQIQDLLEPGEQVIWADKPDTQAAYRSGWIFGGILCGAAFVLLVITISAIASTGGNSAVIGVGVFLGVLALALIGAGIAAPKYMRWRYAKNFYVATDRRALVWASNFFGRPKLRVYPPAKLTRMQSMGVRADGLGTLLFGRELVKNRRGQVRGIVVHGFFFIRNVPQVEKLLRDRLVDPLTDRLSE
jgi:hypothetical protein